MISAIAAMSENRVIGVKNSLPWDIPEDMAFFRNSTQKKTVIMGRKTFESMGKALPKRRNIVITRDTTWSAPQIEVAHSIEGALALCNLNANHLETDEIFIIGGAEIYKQALPFLNRIYLTVIHKNFEGDAFFPEVDFKNEFKIVSKKESSQVEPQPLKYTFLVADRLV